MVRGFQRTVDGQLVEDVPASQRFFSGGGTTVRGFQLDRLGAPNILDDKGLSNGGNGLLLFNGEVRTAITKSIGIATFVDTGNVFARVNETAGFVGLSSALIVLVNAEGRYFVDDREVLRSDVESLKSTINEVAGNDRDRPVMLRADARTPYQAVVTVYDALGQLGFRKVMNATAPQTRDAAEARK